jgi:hypothetical protein
LVTAKAVSLAVLSALALIGLSPAAHAHEEEKGVPAVTDVQEAIAILSSQPDLMDNALDKVKDAQESDVTRGVNLALVKEAQVALEGERLDQALTLLERSIGACPGAPVIEPESAPRTPPPLASPCPSVPHLLALSRSRVGGAQAAVFLAIGGLVILAGLAVAKRIR